tara:strand:- start:9288 stop:9737 length:450 start_codon:yes stop_codon:yes gene_type:complete
MGQGPSSVNYNYVYDNKNSNEKKNIDVDVEETPKISKNHVLKERESEKINNNMSELLNVLKYHTNMVSLDKNFLLQNKLINNELETKIVNLTSELKKNKDEYSRDNEIYKQKSVEVDTLKKYTVSFKYADIGLFMVIIILLGIKLIKKK